MVSLTAIGAMLVPKFGLFINLIGSFACTALAFILPVYIYDKVHSMELTQKWKWIHRALVFFGVLCGGISFFISAVDLINAFSEKDVSAEEIAHPIENT